MNLPTHLSSADLPASHVIMHLYSWYAARAKKACDDKDQRSARFWAQQSRKMWGQYLQCLRDEGLSTD